MQIREDIPMPYQVRRTLAGARERMLRAEVDACWAMREAEMARAEARDIIEHELCDTFDVDAQDAVAYATSARTAYEEAVRDAQYWLGTIFTTVVGA